MVKQRAVDVGHHECDTGHAGLSFNWRMMSSTIRSTGASIETVTGCSSGCRRLQRRELAGQQSRRHEMSLAPAEPVRDQRLRALEIDQADVGSVVHENVAIGALSAEQPITTCSPASQHAVDLGGDRLQPGPAVLVGQGMAGAHLGDIAGGMETCRRPHRASRAALPASRRSVVLPEPDTPITISARGV